MTAPSEPKPPQLQIPIPEGARLVGSKVFVRGLRIEAEIGVHAHEYGRRQPLLLDVELDVAPGSRAQLADTINYETIVTKANQVADEGHFQLVEAFAERLGHVCLQDPRVAQVRVRVEKPEALAPHAAAAGAAIVLVRA